MWTITKWEIKSTFRSRKFLFIFMFQMVTLFSMIFIFNSVLQMMNTGEEIALTPSLNEFACLDVNDPSGVIKDEINQKAVMIRSTSLKSPMENSLLLVDEYNTLPLNA
ncbi:MAG: putative ABC transporter, permease component, partial [Methanobacteriaceae archaeon 41_258]